MGMILLLHYSFVCLLNTASHTQIGMLPCLLRNGAGKRWKKTLGEKWKVCVKTNDQTIMLYLEQVTKIHYYNHPATVPYQFIFKLFNDSKGLKMIKFPTIFMYESLKKILYADLSYIER